MSDVTNDVWILKDERIKKFYDDYKTHIDYIMDNNKSVMPYHDTNHLIGVGYIMDRIFGCPPVGVIAGLYHDFNHIGYTPDYINIENTLNTLPSYVTPVIKSIIRGSEYDPKDPSPYINDHDIVGWCIKRLRDADQLYGIVFGMYDCIEDGLYKEIGGNMSPEEFRKRNVLYHKNLKFYTNTAGYIRDNFKG